MSELQRQSIPPSGCMHAAARGPLVNRLCRTRPLSWSVPKPKRPRHVRRSQVGTVPDFCRGLSAGARNHRVKGARVQDCRLGVGINCWVLGATTASAFDASGMARGNTGQRLLKVRAIDARREPSLAAVWKNRLSAKTRQARSRNLCSTGKRNLDLFPRQLSMTPGQLFSHGCWSASTNRQYSAPASTNRTQITLK